MSGLQAQGSSSRGQRGPGGFGGVGGGHSKSLASRNQNALKYGTPLPITLPTSSLHPSRIRTAEVRRETRSDDSKAETNSITTTSRFLTYFRSFTSGADPMAESSSSSRASKTSEDAIIRPKVKGHFDFHTRSVWITDDNDAFGSSSDFNDLGSTHGAAGEGSSSRARKRLLFERGFFGKGSLSRSDPSWRIRRIKAIKEKQQMMERKARENEDTEFGEEAITEDASGDTAKVAGENGQLVEAGAEGVSGEGKTAKTNAWKGKGKQIMTAEEITRQRRLERKQFKIDRAQAILDASLAAEAILRKAAEKQTAKAGTSDLPADDQNDDSRSATESRNPASRLANVDVDVPDLETYKEALPDGVSRLTPQTFLVRPTRPAGSQPNRGKQKRPPPKPKTPRPTGTETQSHQQVRAFTPRPAPRPEDEGFEDVKDLEHLQLNLEESFFLGWALGSLVVDDSRTGARYDPAALFRLFLTLPKPLVTARSPFELLPLEMACRPDNPFLVSYVAYHHYRSLGWVVKTGIKFCCDWLLYKRGPVFSHAEFAMLVLPHYTAAEDKETSPFKLNHADPMSWQWLNTVNRVNTQVKKTLILVYVQIPAMADITARDWERPELLLAKYKVSEIVIRRFVPARMRD